MDKAKEWAGICAMYEKIYGSSPPVWAEGTIATPKTPTITTTTTPVDYTYRSIRNVTFQCGDASVVELDTEKSTITIDGLTIPIKLLREVAKKINEEKESNPATSSHETWSLPRT